MSIRTTPMPASAIDALAQRYGRDLEAEGISVQSMGGVTNIRAFLERFGPHGMNVAIAGLCDVGEEDVVRRGLEATGLGHDLSRDQLESFGFYVCVADLEDELIRSLGADMVQHVIEAAGESGPWTTFQKQAAQQNRDICAQLRRFMGTRRGRKIRYARLLVEALNLDRVPWPLDGVLAHHR